MNFTSIQEYYGVKAPMFTLSDFFFSGYCCKDDIVTVAVTVVTGFEEMAIKECKEIFGKNVPVLKQRGRIYFNINSDQFHEVQKMRSIDNIYIVARVIVENNFTDRDVTPKDVNDIIDSTPFNLKKYLNIWAKATNFNGKIFPNSSEYEAAKEKAKIIQRNCDESEPHQRKKRGVDPSDTVESDVLNFRVSCERVGRHAFSSTDICNIIGKKLNECFFWVVNLCKFHLEVVCKLQNKELVILLRVTRESKHNRNIISFGPTTLRSTVCYNLVRLANPKPGDIIIDPLCGGGSIPIEATLAYPDLYVLCGDIHSKAMERTKSNLNFSATENKIDLMQWSTTKLPFKDSCIDIAVTDLPFGKRNGKKKNNQVLYKDCLFELGRVINVSSGRVVLLTCDKASFNRALSTVRELFFVKKMVGVNIGGLHAVVYVLERTDVPYDAFRRTIDSHYDLRDLNESENHSEDERPSQSEMNELKMLEPELYGTGFPRQKNIFLYRDSLDD